MITILTTAINRPEIIQRTMDSLIENTDFAKHDCRWVVHIDKIEGLPEAEEKFRAAVQLCRSYEDHFETIVIPNRKPEGAGGAINRMRRHIKGEAIFYLEDDWLCFRDRQTNSPLELKDFLQRLKKYSYCTCAKRMNQCSFNPCFIRADCWKYVTKQIELQVDAEAQVARYWNSLRKKDPKKWAFDPREIRRFKDIGRLWIKDTPLKKWDRGERYLVPATYNVQGKERRKKK